MSTQEAGIVQTGGTQGNEGTHGETERVLHGVPAVPGKALGPVVLYHNSGH
jgi:hypothetical protein